MTSSVPQPSTSKESVEQSSTDRDLPLIRVRGLHQYFGENHVLRGIDLDVYRGETLCLLGTSGGGKTVLTKHMLGLMQPAEGSIEIDGIEIAHMRERHLGPVRKKLGVMFQNGALFDSMSVAQNIAFPLIESGVKDSQELDRRIAEVLEIVHLSGQEEKMPSSLSGGMKKRVALARAIVDHPACVCYDEPHAGLDPITAASIDSLIKCLQTDYGITNIVITHEMRSVFRIADRIIFMKDGQIHWQGKPDAFRACDDPTIQAFIQDTD
ncbi:ATP-binding cassette domain-containing protein [Verrucomicrobiaceae bacterium N1E253]|uniref:ATP-binding cassette domain-containing protein n=1 Tax=Oceaniferula marina TaxID=2748318 RepID=A0A851GEY8_9BACT|nr:ATP-binding cassette domain-containing protein [Oceaniferula marina]NWK56318.1 ATP-binding cassette domain-containing protein [Oceaniferula marina]